MMWIWPGKNSIYIASKRLLVKLCNQKNYLKEILYFRIYCVNVLWTPCHFLSNKSCARVQASLSEIFYDIQPKIHPYLYFEDPRTRLQISSKTPQMEK